MNDDSTNNLAALRHAQPGRRKISQLDLSIRLRMTQNRYWRIENGYETPTEDEKRRIARVLGVTVDALGTFPPAAPAGETDIDSVAG